MSCPSGIAKGGGHAGDSQILTLTVRGRHTRHLGPCSGNDRRWLAMPLHASGRFVLEPGSCQESDAFSQLLLTPFLVSCSAYSCSQHVRRAATPPPVPAEPTEAAAEPLPLPVVPPPRAEPIRVAQPQAGATQTQVGLALREVRPRQALRARAEARKAVRRGQVARPAAAPTPRAGARRAVPRGQAARPPAAPTPRADPPVAEAQREDWPAAEAAPAHRVRVAPDLAVQQQVAQAERLAQRAETQAEAERPVRAGPAVAAADPLAPRPAGPACCR